MLELLFKPATEEFESTVIMLSNNSEEISETLSTLKTPGEPENFLNGDFNPLNKFYINGEEDKFMGKFSYHRTFQNCSTEEFKLMEYCFREGIPFPQHLQKHSNQFFQLMSNVHKNSDYKVLQNTPWMSGELFKKTFEEIDRDFSEMFSEDDF